nr:MBL fold metallo-hydrolase [uncultured Sellimonas sp.]
MIRSFLPVGQGAFYTEQFDSGVNIVYDCGSSTSKSAVEKQIACTFEPRERIQAVFISHLHEDHINGLPYLLSHCCVERLYLPFLTEEEILLTRLIARLENAESAFLSKLLVDPYGAVQDYTLQNDTMTPDIFYVMPPDSTRRPGGNVASVSSGEMLTVLDSGIPSDWTFIPFNFQNAQRSKSFFRGLKKNGYDKKTLQSYLETSDIFSYDWDDLKRIYQKYAPGSLNSNSLVVYSGPRSESGRAVQPYRFFMPDLSDPQSGRQNGYPDGFLFLGDYDAGAKDSWPELTDHLADYMPFVGTVQVPHHGSMHNYNEELSCGQFILIISAGYQNKYKHPHTKVLKDMLMKRAVHFWITEHAGTMVQFRIEEN